MTGMDTMAPALLPMPRADDRYPSRFGVQALIKDRHDPVVWGTPEQGPLCDKQLLFYESQGYLHFDALLTPADVQSCLDALSQLRADETLQQAEEAVIEPGSRELRSLFAVHQINAALKALCQHPKLVAIAQQLLGSEVYIHQSRINYKGGFRGKEFYWHSDFETWHVEDGVPAMRLLSCSIALTANTPYNGPLMILPGSHQRFVPCAGLTPKDHYRASLKQQELGVPDELALARLVQDFGITAPTGLAGAVTFFDCNVMHGSSSNITPLPRSNVFVVYNSLHNTPVEPFCGLPPRPNFIAERRDFTPVALR